MLDEILTVVVAALGTGLVALVAWATKHFVAWVDARTAWMSTDRLRAIKDQVLDRVQGAAVLCAREVNQTFVDNAKADGSWSKDSARQAFNLSWAKAIELLKAEGLRIHEDYTGEFLRAAIEAAVGRLGLEKLVASGKASATAA
jgi:hypothetical protein